jgi:uncharacterized protein
MAKSNVEIIRVGLDIVLNGLRPYVLRELKNHYGAQWWELAIGDSLRGVVAKASRWAQMSDDERFALLDIQAILSIMISCWNDVFQSELGYTGRSYVSELREVRNSWAHQRAFTSEDTYRALDTMQRLLGMTGGEGQEELKKLNQDLLRQRFETETKKEIKKSTAVTQTGALNGFKPWRQVVTPHPDVASGRYQQAEFAADLFQVITGKAESEYGDAREFFSRTYLTEGLIRLLSRAWERLLGKGGDPVVELQTNFGGGKTHSMLALYHLFGGGSGIKEITGLELLIPEAIKDQNKILLPVANRAVLVGTQISPAEARKKPDGTIIKTLWGEMAWQLGDAAEGEGVEAYALVAEEDNQGISPGSEKLTILFETYAPALILIDEWVAYARQIYGKDNLPSGSFDSNMTFAQSLTEAAKAAGNTLVVASIPASDIEIGGEGGRAALERIQNVFSRIESVWKPASSTESFEIVRRRLFQPISDFKARDAVCRAFSEFYQDNRAEFPGECREVAYEERLKSAYPIHPEFFDRLYEDWSSLDRFQRTRGVLRLMAGIIYELWERNDQSLMILPGLAPLDSTGVRFEITRYLPEGWGAVMDRDIDGDQSRPVILDRDNPNLGRYSACRRVARAVFIGSAPSVNAQRVRGVEEIRVKLGCVQPGESPAVFGDALRRLSEELTYLYSDASRYWFDTRPTITRIASDRATQFESNPNLIEDEIIRRVREHVRHEYSDFEGVHTIPENSADVPDEDSCRLVILSPAVAHRARSEESKAITAAQEILERRGNSPRIYRNMLIFLGADSERLEELKQAVRYWMAWTSIKQEEDQLELSTTQRRQVETNIKKYDETILARLSETYCHLIVPTQDGTQPIEWSSSCLTGDGIVARASRRLLRDEELITTWSPATLCIELERWLWKDKDHLSVKQLWEYLASYLYLPRLRDQQVLLDAISKGTGDLMWKEYFAYASAVREDGHYVGLVTGNLPNVILDSASVIVKPEVAQRQLNAEAEDKPENGYDSGTGVDDQGQKVGEGEVSGTISVIEPVEKKIFLRTFHGSADLDPMRVGRDAGRIADEVISHMSGLVGAKVNVTLEINIEVPQGISEEIMTIVSENCHSLKFKSHEFEEG